MMFGERLEITLKMHLDGTLHIGSGLAKEDPCLRDKKKDSCLRNEKTKKDPEVTEVQRDKDNNAVIPATSLKGALRAQAPLGKAELDVLLGEQGEAEKDKALFSESLQLTIAD
jgi:CRISPR/Cas system CSM-associated protein Csm3 (group 7 of RAMP superfamily)